MQKFAVMGLGALLLSITGCGAAQSRKSHQSWPQLTVQVQGAGSLDLAPLILAQKLGFFQENRLLVTITQNREPVSIGPTGKSWPLIGYLTLRPDMVLISESPDPAFRLRALNHLPLVLSQPLVGQRQLAENVLSAHHAQITRWSVLSNEDIQSLWRHGHLPWVLVTLEEAARLKAINPKSAILAWIGASTGPIPSIIITADTINSRETRFIDALNLALWYLHTTPANTIAQNLGEKRSLIEEALRYQFWPATTFPDPAAYIRGRIPWNPHWPLYQQAVNPVPARKALGYPKP